MSRRPWWSWLVDLVAVVALVGLAVVGLDSTFEGDGYLVVATSAAAAGVLLALMTVRLPVAVLVATAPVLGMLLGGPLALRDQGLGAGIPGLRTMADVMAGSVTGWAEMLTTLRPVDLAGPPALVPFLLGLTGGVVAGGAALRGRSAGLPVVLLLPVLAVVLLLRHPVPGAIAWYPAAFAALAVGWMALRGVALAEHPSGLSPDQAQIQGRGRGRALRVVGAAVVVVGALGVAATVTTGTSSATGASLRDRVEAPADVDGLDSPLRRFRTFTRQPDGAAGNVHDRRLLTVTGARPGTRLRFVTLDRYDGREWRAGNDTMAGTLDDRFLRVDTTVAPPASLSEEADEVRVSVEVAKAYRSAWVPTVGRLGAFRFLFADGGAKRDQLRYDLATSTAVVPLGIERGDDYELTAVLPFDRVRPTTRPWVGELLQVERDRRIDRFARTALESPLPPMRKVFALATYLREEGRYSDGGPGQEEYAAGHGLDRLTDDFLLAPRPVGNDEQFAAAMALLANRVGVPARVVVGAVLPRDGVVRGRDVSAWVELRAADGTWRTLPTKEFMGRKPARETMPPAPGPDLGSLLPPQPDLPDPGAEPPTPQEEQEQRDREVAQRGLAVRLAPWVALLVLAVMVPLAKVARRVRRRRRGRASDQAAAAWTELVDGARDLGVPVPLRAPRPAQARALAAGTALAERVDALVFAPVEPEAGEVRGVWEAALAELRAVGGRRRPLRRVWAMLNPVTLVRRPGDRLD